MNNDMQGSAFDPNPQPKKGKPWSPEAKAKLRETLAKKARAKRLADKKEKGMPLHLIPDRPSKRKAKQADKGLQSIAKEAVQDLSHLHYLLNRPGSVQVAPQTFDEMLTAKKKLNLAIDLVRLLQSILG